MKMEADILFDTIGGFGRYQKVQYFIFCLMAIFSMDLLYFNFISYTPDHWCKVHPQNGHRNLSSAEWKNLTVPWDSKANRYSQCLKYRHIENHSRLRETLHENETNTVKCHDWEFDPTVFSNTIVTKWQLVCDKRWFVDLLPTGQSVGILIGSLISGITADRFGRWKATVVCMVVKVSSCILSIFAPSFSVLLFARFMVGLGTLGAYNICFVLALETTQPKHRTWMGVLLSLMFSVGSMILAGFAFLVRDWRLMQLLTLVPSVIFTLMTVIFVHESPRWLLQRGDIQNGMRILRKIAKTNGRPFTESVDTLLTYPLNTKRLESNGSPRKLFSSSTLRKYTLVCLTAWPSVNLIFYALSLNAKFLSGNIFLNFFLLAAVEVPANLIALVCLQSKLLGRKITHVSAFLLAGVACFVSVPLLVVFGKSYITTALAIVGKAGASAAFTGIYIYTAELYPTEIRSWGIGLACLAGKIGSILAPYVGGSLGLVWPPLPSLIFGVTATLSGLLMLLFPETRGRALRDTTDEVEVAELKAVEDTDSTDC